MCTDKFINGLTQDYLFYLIQPSTENVNSYIYGMTFQHLLSQVRLMDANSPLFKSKHYFNIGDRKQNIITCRLRNEASYHNGTGIGTKNADADKKNQRTGYVDMCKRSFLRHNNVGH